MALKIEQKKKSQSNITRISLLIVVGLHVLAYLLLQVPAVKEKVAEAIIEMKNVADQAPPPPPPPPPPQAQNMAPPQTNIDFKPVVTNQVKVDNVFNASMLTNVSGDVGDAVSMSDMAADMGTSDISSMVSASFVPIKSISVANLFNDAIVDNQSDKSTVIGTGQRISGKTKIAVLNLPGNSTTELWANNELETIADFIGQNSSMKVELGARAISFTGNSQSFQSWHDGSLKRALSETKEVSRQNPEIDALKLLADALPYVENKQYETYQLRVKKIMNDYLRNRFDLKISVDKDNWLERLSKESTVPLEQWDNTFLPEVQKAFQQTMDLKSPTGLELKPIYSYLRLVEMIRLPILFYEPQGVPATLLEENLQLIRNYLKYGGFIYIINSVGLDVCSGVRGLISQLIQEDVPDPVGEAALAKLRKDDREVAGYSFRDPTPRIFHPWTFFAISLPRFCDVSFTVYNKLGNPVYNSTLKNMKPGDYLQKNRGERQKWWAVDNDGNEVESGYYIYTMETDLFKKTGAIRVSKLRKLPNGKHPIFSSFFNISEVPTTQSDAPDQLPYGERGVFGAAEKGKLFLCYTEGYKEKEKLISTGTKDPNQIAALKWVTNVITLALQESSLAR